MKKKEFFPDGISIDDWFYEVEIPKLDTLGKQYILTEYQIFDDGKVYTEKIQALIDMASVNGGGVIVVPKGTFLTGALFFKQGVHLYIEKGGVLKGSDDISDYPICETRIEGETCNYYSALINADGLDGFIMCGKGTIDGNGFRSWKAFWLRRAWNPECTNKDEQRPRLVYISKCCNVTVAQLHLQNSHFWTNHIYKSHHVKYIHCRIYSPCAPVAAPSTDGIDIDVCKDVLIKHCYFEVNDDSVVLKGGKGPTANSAPENGSNERILIEDCTYGWCHSCLTCGSESIHNRNILVRRIRVKDAVRLVWLKMRSDTPQRYEYITVEEVEGKVKHFIDICPWTQFFDMKGYEKLPLSYAENIKIKNCNCECDTYFKVKSGQGQYILSDFSFENLSIKAKNDGFSEDIIENVVIKNVNVDTQNC